MTMWHGDKDEAGGARYGVDVGCPSEAGRWSEGLREPPPLAASSAAEADHCWPAWAEAGSWARPGVMLVRTEQNSWPLEKLCPCHVPSCDVRPCPSPGECSCCLWTKAAERRPCASAAALSGLWSQRQG